MALTSRMETARGGLVGDWELGWGSEEGGRGGRYRRRGFRGRRASFCGMVLLWLTVEGRASSTGEMSRVLYCFGGTRGAAGRAALALGWFTRRQGQVHVTFRWSEENMPRCPYIWLRIPAP